MHFTALKIFKFSKFLFALPRVYLQVHERRRLQNQSFEAKDTVYGYQGNHPRGLSEISRNKNLTSANLLFFLLNFCIQSFVKS